MESDPSTVDDAADLNAVLKWRDIRTRCIKVGERRRLRPVAFFFFLSFFLLQVDDCFFFFFFLDRRNGRVRPVDGQVLLRGAGDAGRRRHGRQVARPVRGQSDARPARRVRPAHQSAAQEAVGAGPQRGLPRGPARRRRRLPQRRRTGIFRLPSGHRVST